MYNFLVDHARQNVWCNPDQDNQLIFAAHRLTKPVGELNRFTLMNRVINLPEQSKRYHIYQVGQVHPNIVGLLPINPGWVVESWVKFSDAINNLKLFVDIYTADGIELPKFKSYYMYTNDRDLIFAIEIDTKFDICYTNDKIYTRLYTNAYFQSHRSDAAEDYIFCKGLKILNINQILSTQNEVATYKAKRGYVFTHVNGIYTDNIDLTNTAVGDVVEFIYDSSVKRVVTFTVNELHTFSSILDDKYKYLLHHSDGVDDTIDYQDDIDIHILHTTGVNKFKGNYYHRNNEDSHRMVTHRSYSIVVDYFTFLAQELNLRISETPIDFRSLKLQLKVRESGYYRPLVFDNNRIFELFKLPYSKIMQAMTGVHTTVPEWQAENLENCAYTKLMRSKWTDINIEMFQDGYGYNGISSIVGGTPSKTVLRSGRQSADLPYNLYQNCTVYEYDVNGNLLGHYYHLFGNDYESNNNDTRLVEVISGRGSHQPDVKFGTTNIPLPVYDNYRVYMCHEVGGVADNQWLDITGSNLYSVVNNILIWNDLDFNQFLMVRTDMDFLAYDIELMPTANNLYFTLSELEDRGNGLNHYTLPIPLGEIDLFLNGKSLIRNLDYIIDFPTVYILNKKYLVQPAYNTIQNVHVRFTGFCKSDMSLDAIEDFGFIEHGVFSNNNRYDIRDDKVLRITIDGKTIHRDEIVFSEFHDGISVVNPINGLPYQIKDIVVPLKQLVNENTYSLREKSIAIDERVSNYMTIKLPQPEREFASSIMERYPLVSPFISRIIYALISNIIDNSLFMSNLSDNQIIDICKPFEFLLTFDPINEQNSMDHRHVIIYPHALDTVIDLDLYQYRFLTRVVKLYCNDLVQLSPFVTFSS